MPAKNLAVIDEGRCDRRPWCPAARACPQGAIKPDEGPRSGFGPPPFRVDPALCSGCGSCVKACPRRAISLSTRE